MNTTEKRKRRTSRVSGQTTKKETAMNTNKTSPSTIESAMNAVEESAAEALEGSEQISMEERAMDTSETPESALDSAMHAMTEGAKDAAEAVAQAPAEIGKFVSKTVYGSFYYLSYGIVFSALVVAKLIPKNSAIEHGIHDGAIAAREAFKKEEAETSHKFEADVAEHEPSEGELATA